MINLLSRNKLILNPKLIYFQTKLTINTSIQIESGGNMNIVDYNQLLLDLKKTGNIDSFEKLYNELKHAVFGVSLAVLKDYSLAEDCMQDVFIKVKQNISQYSGKSNGKAWILQIARNQAIDIIRKRKNIVTEIDIDDAYGLNFEDSNSLLLDQIILKKALEHLDLIERQIVILYAISGFSHKEIADILKIPYATARWKYQNSIKKLAKYI
jgi:RNA polymerase sigma factor, sigma-70 family